MNRKSNLIGMPGAGLEPARVLTRGILSPLRLPIPPPGLKVVFYAVRLNHFNWRRRPDSNRGIAVLQTAALPLGYAA